MTSSDEDVNILATCFCLTIFISSGSGYSGFTSIEINRSIIVVIKAPCALTTKSDLELFFPVTSSDEDITIFRGYCCKYQLAKRPVRQGITCETSSKRASQTSKQKHKPRKALWVTLAFKVKITVYGSVMFIYLQICDRSGCVCTF